MKKSLVLAMALAMGATASAYAANPFSDVPAGHWAYDSISNLVDAGVVEGYPDGTFGGDKLMTRYEMAQIVAKAMAKGANVDRLAAEFADELDALGVRVAALEKKSDNVTITGEIRYHYGWAKQGKDKDTEDGLRSRLYFTGAINDDWTYTGRLQNQQYFLHDYTGNEETKFNVAMVEGRLGGLNVQAGRMDDVFADGYIFDGEHDAVKLSYGDKVYLSGAFGKATEVNEDYKPDYLSDKFWQAELGTNNDGGLNAKVGYMVFDGDTTMKDERGEDADKIFYAGLNFGIGDDFVLDGMYLKSNIDKVDYDGAMHKTDDDGYTFGLSFKGADPEEVGSWGLAARYYHQGGGTYLAHTIDGETGWVSGFKGWSVGGDVTLAKNMVLSSTYYQTKALNSDEDNEKVKVLWSEFNITF